MTGGGLGPARPAGDPDPDPDRLRLVASSIAGRLLEVGWVEAGEPAFTDGVTVFVDRSAEHGDQLASLVVQAALLAAGSLGPEILRPLARRPALARRYLAVEGHRALAEQGGLLPPRVRGLVDRATAARTSSPAESLALAGGRERLDDPPALFGTVRARSVLVAAERGGGDGTAVEQHVPRKGGDTPERELDDDGDDTPPVDLFSSPVGGGGAIGKVLAKLLRQGRAAGTGPPGADAPTHRSRSGGRPGATTAVSTVAARLPEELAGPSASGATYPEWDRHRRRYRPDWCTVVELDPKPTELAPFAPPDSKAVRRPLSRLGLGLERRRRQLQGDDIDLDAAVEARVELMAGSVPDEAVYLDSLRRRRDLAVLLLLDVSGSAGEPGPTGAPVHEQQRAAAAQLAAALSELGDRVALYGFRSQGRSAVHLVRVKRFGDGLDARALLRLGGLVPGGYTRLGAAIRHGAAVLEREAGTPRRLLVVLSDGFAYDHGYERDYGEADARRALAEARRRGIGTLCLSIGGGADAAALRRVFGVAAHAAVPTLDRLPPVVGPLFRSALGSAEQARRVFQHRDRTTGRHQIERHEVERKLA